MAKLNVRWQLSRAPIGAVLVGVLALVLLGGCGVQPDPARSHSEAESSVSRGNNSNPALFPAQSHPYGASMETWAERWWAWELSIPAAENPLLTSSSDCGVNQEGPVFFIPASPAGAKNVTRSCIVEHGKALALNMSSVVNDYPCPDPTFQPPPGQSLFDFLLAGAVAANGDVAEIDVTLDGEPLNDLLAYHFASEDLFLFKGDTSLQGPLDSCITGAFQPAVVDSYIILFKPLSPGRHTITRRVVTTRGTVSGPNTTEVEVLAGREPRPLGERER